MNGDELFDQDRIEAIASALELRQPNKEALEAIAYEAGRHFELDQKPPPMRAVIDSATGVGKTYIMLSAIEYLAADGVRNFAIITPGRAILDKTVVQFTPGTEKSLLEGMDWKPVLVTSDNFDTPAMRRVLDDPDQVKLFVFTVQALIRPTSNVARKTREFQEGLGEAFVDHLAAAEDLVVFEDEQHTYFGPAFSQALADLKPRISIGLTATPHRDTPEEEIIYRYPMAAAIADELVKTPVIVGRKDDRTDPETKLLDGLKLIELKEKAMARYAEQHGLEPVAPLLLVIAPSIEEANEIETIVKDPNFAGGAYTDKVLTVHSDAPEETLAKLDEIDAADDPYRILISVGMLDQGWDNRRVYVLASLRASVSRILTEQTLGRGLRLPFGEYTGLEILDTLEVLGHERYEELLRRAGALKEEFIDRRTRAVLRRDAEGREVPTTETTEVTAEIATGEGERRPGEAGIASVEEHTEAAEAEVENLAVELSPRTDLPRLKIPRLRMTTIKADFSLADITEYEAFESFGRSIATNPEEELRRVRIGARVVTGRDGLRKTELVTGPAIDRVVSEGTQLSLEDARTELAQRLLMAPAVPQVEGEAAAAEPIIEAFMSGLGDKAQQILSAHMDRAAGGLIRLVSEEQRRFARPPSYEEVVELVEFGPTRQGRPKTSEDRTGTFKKGTGYEGYSKSLYSQDWFDSSPERTVANVLDDEDEIDYWVRLQRNDLPILWTEGGREYNPDLVAVEKDGTHWVIEVKMDREMSSEEVQEKRRAARRWANYVTRDDKVEETWHYLLLSETDIKTARGSWEALKGLGS